MDISRLSIDFRRNRSAIPLSWRATQSAASSAVPDTPPLPADAPPGQAHLPLRSVAGRASWQLLAESPRSLPVPQHALLDWARLPTTGAEPAGRAALRAGRSGPKPSLPAGAPVDS